MLMLALAISCLTTSNLLWFIDLHTRFLCSIVLTASDFTSITSHINNWTLFLLWLHLSPFFLELFLYSSPVAYWAPTDLGSSSFSVISFCLVILFMALSKQEYWSGLPFPSLVDHILSQLSTMTHVSWVAPQGMAHSFFVLGEAVVSICLPSDGEGWNRLTEGITGSCSHGQGHAQ